MEVTPQRSEAVAWLRRLFATSIRPDRKRPLDEWTEAERVVSEGGYQGPWRHKLTPYLVEPMRYAGLNCATPRVTIRGGAQIGKTQVGVNLAGQCLTETPTQVLVMLPSLTSLQQYNRDKLDRMITATPALLEAVADITERSGAGSTVKVKRGARGAQVELVTASSSKDLQSRTCQVVVMEEVSEYEADVGGRGHPADQGEARTYAFRKRRFKIVKISTPGEVAPSSGGEEAASSGCHITDELRKGSDGRYFVCCPDCRHPQELKFAKLFWERGKPESAHYVCDAAGCGSAWQESQKAALLLPENGAHWRHKHPDRLTQHASFSISALYSNMLPWSEIARQAEACDLDPSKLKTFSQQMLGEPWDQAFDMPKAEVLMLRRDTWPKGRVPPGVLFLVGATDVQGAYLEWAVWGFDLSFGQWRIAGGSIQGDPTQPEVWREHSEVVRRTWRDAWGRDVRPRSWGVDSSYLSSHVYAYVLGEQGRHPFSVMALDGRDGWRLPPIGKERWRVIRRPGQEHLPETMLPKVPIYPVGTWDMKSELASALRLTERGPGPEGWPVGALRFNEDVDKAWIEELLAERFVQDPRTGKREWKRLAARNEAWDLAVYCRAQARAITLGMTPEQWAALVAETQGQPEEAQGDLLGLVAPTLKAQAAAAAAAKVAEAAVRARRDAEAALSGPRRVVEERLYDGAEDFWGED